jgi:hypothetical protein
MRFLIVLAFAWLIPAAALAGGECREELQKFCKDQVEAKQGLGACLDQHEAELSPECKSNRAVKKSGAEEQDQPKKAKNSDPDEK